MAWKFGAAPRRIIARSHVSEARKRESKISSLESKRERERETESNVVASRLCKCARFYAPSLSLCSPISLESLTSLYLSLPLFPSTFTIGFFRSVLCTQGALFLLLFMDAYMAYYRIVHRILHKCSQRAYYLFSNTKINTLTIKLTVSGCDRINTL